VVERRIASRLHYDLRLEYGGTLRRFAVPRGPSMNPLEKRLAVETPPGAPEDPEARYGVWDSGRVHAEGDLGAGLRRGSVSLELDGHRLKGTWTLERAPGRESDEGPAWWLTRRADGPEADAAESPAAGARVRPQLATLVTAPPPGDEWLHEVKLDGYRLFCRVEDGRARLLTREGRDWTDRLAPIGRAVEALRLGDALVDGELVSVQPDGSTSFEALQRAIAAGASASLVYYAFDLLRLDGRDVSRLPLERRKAFLEARLGANWRSGPVRFSEHVEGLGPAFFERACADGLEGVVSKRRRAPYRPGRNRDWVKTRCLQEQAFVVGGYTAPRGSRVGLGALFIGVYADDGRLFHAGRVGTGFDETALVELHRRLAPLERSSSPFANRLSLPPGARWVEPRIVVRVAFTEWTRDGRLRHPSYRGLRDDKPAREVRRERPLGTASTRRAAAGGR
jgi:bifunctional non-homologous end joining protein LigD